MSQSGLVSDSTTSGSDIETLTGNTGGAVGPDAAFNIDIVGTGDLTVTGNPGTNTLTISDTSASDVETLTGDTGGAVSPDGSNNINLLTTLSSDFNLSELRTVGNPGANTITITQFNTLTGFVSGVGASTINVITFDLGATAAVYIMDIRMVVFDSGNVEGAGYNIFGTIRTTGAAATLVGTPDKIVNEEGGLLAGDANMIATGNNFQLQFTIPAGSTVDVTAYVKYTKQEI